MEPTQHEKFLKGIPITPELAELANPAPEKGEPKEEPDATAELLKPFSKRERKRLSKLKGSEDWALALRALDMRIEKARHHAISLSEQNPEGNVEGMKAAWLYVKAFKAIRLELDNIIETAARENSDETGMGEQRPTA